jgi:uncharacterized Tic20 family protein
VIRNLHGAYKKDPNQVLMAQIVNLRKRLYLTRSMQIFGISSLLLCVVSMFLVYIKQDIFAVWSFGLALVLLIVSLALLIWEIQISVKALELHLEDIEGE